MKISDLIKIINGFADEAWAFDGDNTGLQVGSGSAEVDSILLCVDVTEAVVDEAIQEKCDMILSHHPLLFIPLRNVTDSSEKGRIVRKLVRHDIAVYSSHTSFDVSSKGINAKFAEELGMTDVGFLDDWADRFCRIEVYVPSDSADAVLQAMFDAGAGAVGNYKECGYRLSGEGQFTPVGNAHPGIGELNSQTKTRETKLELLAPREKSDRILAAMLHAHPYETPVYQIIYPEKIGAGIGIGAIGAVQKQTAEELITTVKKICNTPHVRISNNYQNKIVRKVAFCGGSGTEYFSAAKAKGADVFITAECKSYDFANEVESGVILISPSHFASESIFIRSMQEARSKYFGPDSLMESKAQDREWIV
jgi:dinuclear metal center YbgI/SA1388 family protein